MLQLPTYKNEWYMRQFTAIIYRIYRMNQTYEVSAIIGSRINPLTQQKEYLIHWLGYSPTQATWEPIEHLEDVRHLVDDYENSIKPHKPPKATPKALSKRIQKANRVERRARPRFKQSGQYRPSGRYSNASARRRLRPRKPKIVSKLRKISSRITRSQTPLTISRPNPQKQHQPTEQKVQIIRLKPKTPTQPVEFVLKQGDQQFTLNKDETRQRFPKELCQFYQQMLDIE